MKKVRILHSDYQSFAGAVGKTVMAVDCGCGWEIPVCQSVKLDRDKIWRDEAEMPIESQPVLFFSNSEIEVITPFDYWNRLKSGKLHQAA